MRYLVTGGAGFIGTALVARLLAEGHEVTVLDSFSGGKTQRVAKLGCKIFWADVRDKRRVSNAARYQDSVIHLAYIQGTKNFYEKPSEVLSVALEGTEAVIDACRVHRIRELVLVSSAEAHQSSQLPTPEDTPLTVPDVLNPRFSYGGGKIANELQVAAAHHDGFLDRAIIIRPHNVVGPDMSDDHVIPDLCQKMNKLTANHPDIARYSLPVQGTGQETRCYTYIDDAIDQFMLIMDKAKGLGAYHLGSQDERTTAELAHEIAKCYGKQVNIIPSKLTAGSPQRRQPGLGFLDGLGYKPKTDFEETVARTVAWYRGRE